jgi:hypothetical protein
VITGANKKQMMRRTNMEFDIFNCCEKKILTFLELIRRSGDNMISNKEIILSITDKLSCE